MAANLIPEDILTEVRERADIVDVVSSYVALTRTGQNLKGLCPFHSEKTPSFTVSPSRQIFHCFGCGTGGNVFTFLMKIDGASFPEAVRELGKRLGIPVPTAPLGTGPAGSQSREPIERIHEVAARWFKKVLWDRVAGRVAIQYLEQRGIAPETTESFGLGYAPPAWDGLLRALAREGFALADIAAAGLSVAKEQSGRRASDLTGYYDRFRSRVMFPITDLRRRTVAFGGRIIGDGEPKYLNSPETVIFSKGRQLYALDRAREAASREGRMVIVEGYFDAIALHQAGITNVVATLGTALTPDHLALLRRFANKVVLLFDPDAAGVRAALRTLDLFVDSGIGVTVVSLPDGDDPDTYVRKHGADAFLRLREHAPSLLDFAVEQSLQRAATGSMDDRVKSVDEILKVLQKTSNRIEKEECLRRVAERLGINQQRLVERYPELLMEKRETKRALPAAVQKSPPKRSPEEWDLVYLLLHGHFSASHIQSLSVDRFTDPQCRRLVEIALRSLDETGRPRLRALLDEGVADAECHAAVTELSTAERHFDDIPSHIDGCLQTLERKRRQRNLEELIVRLRAAEQAGHEDEARRLNAEVNALRAGKTSVPVRI